MVTQGSKRIICNAMILTESLYQYCTEIVLTTFGSLSWEHPVTIKTDTQTLQYRVGRAEMVGDGETAYTLYPEMYLNLLESHFPAVSGHYSVGQLCSLLGIPLDSKSPTTEQIYWSIPEYKLHTILREIQKYTLVRNGGGVLSTFNSVGELLLVDLASAYQRDSEITISGNIISDIYSNEWKVNSPGIVKLSLYGVSSGEHVLHFKDGYGTGNYRVYSSVNMRTPIETFLRNDFFSKYYSSRMVEIESTSGKGFVVGTKVKIHETGREFIVRSNSYNLLRSSPTSTITLISN